MLKLTNEDFLEMIRESTEGFRTESTVIKSVLGIGETNRVRLEFSNPPQICARKQIQMDLYGF